MNYSSMKAFLAADPARQGNDHRDFGYDWRSQYHSNHRRYRLSWCERTGEVYLADLSSLRAPVTVLGVIPDRETLDYAVDKWPHHCGRAGGLEWVIGRVRAHTEEEVSDEWAPTAA